MSYLYLSKLALTRQVIRHGISGITLGLESCRKSLTTNPRIITISLMSISFAPKISTAAYPEGIMAADVFEVNVSNNNGFAILTELGIEADYCGSIAATELRERALCALGFASAAEVPGNVSQGEGGATIIDCGRREGYMPERIGSLLELATLCERYGWAVCWG